MKIDKSFKKKMNNFINIQNINIKKNKNHQNWHHPI